MYWILTLLPLAFAQPVDEPALPDDLMLEEMIVVAQRNVAEARAIVDEAVRALGYLPPIRARDRDLYVHPQIWRPRVTIYRGGYARVKARAFTPMWGGVDDGYAQVSGVWGSPRMARGMESSVLRYIAPELEALRGAIQDEALLFRREEIRGELAAIWGGGASAAERRAGVLACWLNTSDTDAGAEIRWEIEAFIDREIQRSAHPFTDAEVAAANDRRGFEVPLELAAY